jgi:hypothetical protein
MAQRKIESVLENSYKGNRTPGNSLRIKEKYFVKSVESVLKVEVRNPSFFEV